MLATSYYNDALPSPFKGWQMASTTRSLIDKGLYDVVNAVPFECRANLFFKLDRLLKWQPDALDMKLYASKLEAQLSALIHPSEFEFK